MNIQPHFFFLSSLCHFDGKFVITEYLERSLPSTRGKKTFLETGNMKDFHETSYFIKWKCPLSTWWIAFLTALQCFYHVTCGVFFVCLWFSFENKPRLSSVEQLLRFSFYLPFLESFFLCIADFFRSEEWLAFKNCGLKFGEKESCGSCGEEKHFGS